MRTLPITVAFIPIKTQSPITGDPIFPRLVLPIVHPLFKLTLLPIMTPSPTVILYGCPRYNNMQTANYEINVFAINFLFLACTFFPSSCNSQNNIYPYFSSYKPPFTNSLPFFLYKLTILCQMELQSSS